MRRLARWCRTHAVTDVLGTHIEMTAEPGVDYEFASTEHANERALQLGPEHVYELVETIATMSRGEELERTARDDFIVFPLRPRRRDSD